MRLFLKFGSLFALILVGRYMQPTAAVAPSQPRLSLARTAPVARTAARYVAYTDTSRVLRKQVRRKTTLLTLF